MIPSTMTRRVVIGLVSLMTIAATAGCGLFGGGTRHISAEFKDALGLYVGNDVSVLGVKVGTVTGIRPEGTSVLVDLTVQDGIKIPADAAAVTVSPALVTNRRVELTPVYRGGPTMPDGALIPISRTRTPVEVDEVFNAADRLSSQLGKVEGGKAALTDALDAAAGTFAGNGDKLHKALQGLAAATGVGVDQRNQLIEVLKDVDDLSQKAVQQDGTIRSLTTNLNGATQLFDSQGPKLTDTVNNLDYLIGETNRLIEQNRDRLNDTIDNGRVITHTLAGRRRELSEAADVLPTLFQNLANVVDPGRQMARAHVNLDQVLLPPQLLQGVCQKYGVPLLCATMAAAGGQPAGLTQLGNLLRGSK